MDTEERMHKLRNGSDTAKWAAKRIEDLEALLEEYSLLNERNVDLRAALENRLSFTFDGFAVYSELSEKAKTRTSAENVSDVLDSLVRLYKKPTHSTKGG